MEKRKLSLPLTFSEAIETGIKNAPSIVGCVALFVLTCWIPYLNVGTYIAISLLPVELAKGEVINPLHIFSPKYRRYMGEYLLTQGLIFLGTMGAVLFFFFPAFVVAISWSLSVYFLIERNMNPMQAIKASNDATYGSKWMIFFVVALFVILCYILLGILAFIGGALHSTVFTALLMLVGIILVVSVAIAIQASIWKQLKDNVE